MAFFARVKLDAWIAVTVALLSVGLLKVAEDYPSKASLYPKLLLAALIILSIVVAVQSFIAAKPEAKTAAKHTGKNNPYVWVCFVYLFIVGYATMFEPLGFLLSTMIFTIAMMKYFGENNWLTLLGVSIAFNIFVYAAFIMILDVPIRFLPDFFQ